MTVEVKKRHRVKAIVHLKLFMRAEYETGLVFLAVCVTFIVESEAA
jgi:hypothetical protein